MLEKLKLLGNLVAIEHTVFSGMFILIALVVAGLQVHLGVVAGLQTLLLCALALLFARNFAMGFNRLVDRKFDIKNKRTQNRPSVDGRINLTTLRVFCVANALCFVGVSYAINALAFKLSLPFLVILAGYSYMKRFSYLAHLVLGVCLGLAPIAGVVAVLGTIPLWSVWLAFGVAFWVAGFDLLYSLQDVEFDRKEGLYSVPAVFGEQVTLWVSRTCHALAVLLWASFVHSAHLGGVAWLGVGVCLGILIYEQWLVLKDFKNIPKAFFVTNGYLGVVFLGFVVMDRGLAWI
ncbi:menaquinone biosynthesis prenyltransferase MqnP [Helicobacter ailurogastricus]|uniref:menaquinone biosynthesis prenyltransferase MqnP n=1 Tax=Helicobacter ailurogastricus TaxID=1578720 RepID=UPI0022BC4AD6|nr:menaquinone biosynthesis prenyltransferase MqnP [Helicobacter ailurogastricus]GLH58315.1 4-hydroxybenzoate polyprenyltransferase UbiA [Helicobacter ailurogastricus]GLH59869.1 4-hydroxybenzoate polyprenyltransferase UbiA [Helicobacter ailurogastricus]